MDLTQLARSVVDGLRLVGVPVCLAAVLVLAAMALTPRSRRRLLLAGRGFQTRPGPSWRLWTAGILLPMLGITALSAAFAIESEIRDGQTRLAEGVEALVPPGAGSPYWVLAPGTDHFMDTSRVSLGRFAGAAPGDARSTAVLAVPFRLDLAVVTRQSGERITGLVLGPGAAGDGLSPPVAGPSVCERREARCLLKPGEVVVDREDGYALGEVTTIRGEHYRVVGFFDRPMSLLNRTVVYANTTAAGYPQDPFGYVAFASDRATVEAAAGPDVQVLSAAEVRDYNAQFWSGNATPILMLLILLIAAFGGAAIFAAQRAEHLAVRPVFRTVRAIGLTRTEAGQIDLAHGLLRAAIPVIPALILARLAIAALNWAVLGFHARVELLTLTAAFGVVAAASTVAGLISWSTERTQPLVTR